MVFASSSTRPLGTLIRFLFLLAPLLPVQASNIRPSFEERNADSPLFTIVPENKRFRYRLYGLEPDWIEPLDDMNLAIYFIGEDRVTIRRVAFLISGSSPGWSGDLDAAPFVPRREVVSVPPGTVSVQIIFTSSGSPRCVGAYLVKNFSAFSTYEGAKKVILEKGLPPGQELLEWFKSGDNPSMALEGLDFPAAFRIIDHDLNAHADWGLRPFPVSGGNLVLEWQEAYSISKGGDHPLSYDRLPPGEYRLEVEELSITGTPSGEISFVEVGVPHPIWKIWWFWLLCFALLAAFTYLSMRSAVNRKVRRAVRHSRLIENERLRIAMDLHDDIGTRLSQISLIGSHARMTATNSGSKESFQKITGLTGELVSSLSETVWMLSPKNNDLESLIGFLCRTASELCRNAQIRCRIDADSIGEELPITHEFRHHFVLSVKEALNNAIKHSHANEILLQIKIGSRDLTISVADNGNGMPPDLQSNGNGLASLKRRMKEINGIMAINPSTSGGVQILLEAPLKQEEY